jgi:hypothetical protein
LPSPLPNIAWASDQLPQLVLRRSRHGSLTGYGLTQPAPLAVFELPERYVFERDLGKGAYGFVCCCKVEATGESVAVKKVTILDEITEARRVIPLPNSSTHISPFPPPPLPRPAGAPPLPRPSLAHPPSLAEAQGGSTRLVDAQTTLPRANSNSPA